MKIKIYPSPADYDSDRCRWINDEGQEVGFGLVPKSPEADPPDCVYLERCPKCLRENYAMSVSSGMCSWCGWDANLSVLAPKTEHLDAKKTTNGQPQA